MPKRTSRCDEWSRPPCEIGALEQADRRHERRVEHRHRKDENRQEQCRDGRAGDVPARGQAERREREAEHLCARVAHEHERFSPRAEVEGQEPGAGARTGEREREVGVVRVNGDGVDREEPERDPGERGREPVHVVEQVERVRHPDEPEDRERPRDDMRVDQLDAGTGREHDHRGRNLEGELQLRRQRPHVVDEPGREEQ